MVRIETSNEDIILWGSTIGTIFHEKDQEEIIKWFMENKPKMIQRCRKEVREKKQVVATAKHNGVV